MIDLQILFWSLTATFFAGSLIPVLGKRWVGSPNISLFFALVGSVVGALATGAIWFGLHPTLEKVTILMIPWLPDSPLFDLPALQWEARIDHLSAFFGFLISSFSAIVGIYSFEALRAAHYHVLRHRITSAFNLFIWSTLMVVIVNDVFSLIVMLEIMTLAFGFLALYKHTLYQDSKEAHQVGVEKKKDARIAPQVYLIISHTSTAFLLVALLLLAIPAGSLSFGNLHAGSDTLNSVVFLLALAGLGIRAGLVPSHFWVSLVHPSSPTTTHALSLGIAIKVAVYLMYRFFFQFLEPHAWWGYLVLVVAVITALVNVWYAISSHDLKTALAYHSVENVGIIVVGIGVALIFAPVPTPIARWIATLALVASLYHLLNHAVFKGLLYLATGAIDNLTHQVVEFHKLGGLIKRYRWTSAAFLVGAISISGFPPFNGFISEWLMLQVLFRGAGALKPGASPGIAVIFVSLVLLVTSFALTAFCFYKIAGLTLLGETRSSYEEQAKWANQDVSWKMGVGMAVMAALCLLLGTFPGRVVPLLSRVVHTLGFEVTLVSPSWTGMQVSAPRSISDPLMLLSILGVAAVLMLVPIIFGLRREIRRPPAPMNCGTPYSPANMQYTGAALSELIRRLFDYVPRRLATATLKTPDYLPAHLKLSYSKRHPQEVVELFRASDNLVIHTLLTRSKAVGEYLQNRDIRRYLFYIFFANLTALLLFLIFGD